MADRFLETKFHIPLWRAGGVMRPRLLDQLQAGLIEQRKLTLVSAPAGYGKTTLITSWLYSFTESTRNVWLSLEKSDNESARFLSYWATAWNRISDFALENILALLEAPQLPPFQNILNEIINTLALLEEPAILVLDDYHLITNPLIHEMLEYFLEHQPRHAHLVIITRSDPSLPLARFRARGQMVEIRASDLRFTEEEASHFFNQSMQLDLKEDTVNALEARTEGWAVGLQLAALALKNLPDPQSFVETFRGSRTKIFLELGARVIAVEPQVSCADLLEKHYGDKEDVTVIQKALGAHVGLGEMMLCAANPISSLSESWIQAVQASGRFPLHAWGKKQLVQITTLDDLIAHYGQPSFIKIDVEGYEYEVLQGLSQPVKALSLELISEYLDATRHSIAHLQTLGEPTFNYALGETMQLILDSWVTAREIMTRLSQLENISGLSGDLYIRYSDS